jgi:hypothetical protein
MDTLGIHTDVAKQIINDELAMYQATRFRLTTRLRVLNRVGTDEQTKKALVDELEKLESIILEYESELAEIA